jgi:hypothetical protein
MHAMLVLLSDTLARGPISLFITSRFTKTSCERTLTGLERPSAKCFKEGALLLNCAGFIEKYRKDRAE